ncbi:MAG TPA: ATP-binding cassette domain-containing protein [Thermoanaerobaculales bacterium]|nr:ATP-binding cassette domain-containing protein [Thermoanaerobaculales bacterium]
MSVADPPAGARFGQPARGLAVRRLSVRYPHRGRGPLAGVELELAPGEVACLRGRSGSGKTTLLAAINGLVPWFEPATVEGRIELDGAALDDLDPGQRAPLLGSCLDRADSQLFLATPRHELAAAARLHGGSPAAVDLVGRLGIGPLLDRRTTTLSSGERQRVTLAAALTAAPRPVLLDEPTAHLDPGGARALAAALAEVALAGGSALIADHAGWRLNGAVGRWLELRDRRALATGPPPVPRLPAPDHRPGDDLVLEARGLVLERSGRRLAGPVDLEVRVGEVVLVNGPNGAGKSTLARALASGRAAGGAIRRSGRVALMLPDATIQLLQGTVLGELQALCRDRQVVARVLRRHRLEALAARAPWTLSRGERQRLVLAALDVTRPSLLVVDEPAQGLDPEDLASFVNLVHRRAAKGRACLLISHREELAGAAHRRLVLDHGRLEEAGR